MPWLVSVNPTPSWDPVAKVDAHVKENIMHDLYTSLVAPIVEETNPAMGSFVEVATRQENAAF